MPVRRLKPLRIVVTGVENSGKTTLTRHLAQALGWPWVAETARADSAVTEARVTPEDLQRLMDGFKRNMQLKEDTLFDTGPIVLDLWARTAFGKALDGVEEATAGIDLFLLCGTLTEWAPDPLRSLPRLEDRLALERRYRIALANSGRPWVEIPVGPVKDRLALAAKAIEPHLEA